MTPCFPYKPFLPTGVIGSVISLVFAAVTELPSYRVAPVFLVPLIWAPVLLRRMLDLHPFHYLLFVLAVLVHNAGALGWYQNFPLGFSFDILVHFYFGFAATFMVRRFLKHQLPVNAWAASGLALFVVMGSGALHEIMEYGTYLALGEEKGMLKPKTSYFFDTQRDLLDNLLGVLLALGMIGAWGLIHRSGAEERQAATAAAAGRAANV